MDGPLIPRHGNSKVTRSDWLKAARDILVAKGEGAVKIMPLAAQLGVSRSSFYWYFQDRSDVFDALLDDWETRNTTCIVEKCQQPSETIAQAVCHSFECFIDDQLFDQGLDFAVREWSRRDGRIRAKIDQADATRIAAVRDIFLTHGYAAQDADARARILYFMQLGYHALEVQETLDTRFSRLEAYIQGFTGQPVPPAVVEDFKRRFYSSQ